MPWRVRIAGVWDDLRDSLWLLPAVVVVAAAAVAGLLMAVEPSAARTSSQFTPRLLRTFLRDRGVQTVLSVMMASAVFDVIVLGAVRSSGDGVQPFVPRLAVTAALILAGAAVALLVYFLHHVTQRRCVHCRPASTTRRPRPS